MKEKGVAERVGRSNTVSELTTQSAQAEFAVALLSPRTPFDLDATFQPLFISEKGECQCYVHILSHQFCMVHVSSAMPEKSTLQRKKRESS